MDLIGEIDVFLAFYVTVLPHAHQREQGLKNIQRKVDFIAQHHLKT